jgi:plastocyanin
VLEKKRRFQAMDDTAAPSRHDRYALIIYQVNHVKQDIDNLQLRVMLAIRRTLRRAEQQLAGAWRQRGGCMNPHRKRWLATTLAAAGLFVLGGLGATAQGGTPAAATGGDDHPAHIHVGSCDNLDPNPTYPLTDVMLPQNGTAPSGDVAPAIPVEQSVTTVDAKLADLQSGGYAINIHHSADDIGTYIACGNLGGAVVNDTLVVGLHELNDSGHSGIAMLTAQDDQTVVTVYLAQGLSGAAMPAMGTPAAGAASAAAAAGTATANAVTVHMQNLSYNPATVEIPVGGTVTWVNDDPVPHTATARDRSLLQSGTIAPGQSFSQTFDMAGTIEYFCEFHANMNGTIVVK